MLVASTQSSRTTSATRANSERLSSSDSGAASITMSASASAAELRRRLDRPGRARLEPPLLDLVLEPLGDAGQPALERLGVGVVDERARARRRGELRDAGAHRAGAEDPTITTTGRAR